MDISMQLNEYIEKYVNFMKIESFPQFKLQTRNASLSYAESQGYESIASTSYQTTTGEHTLVLSSNLQFTNYLAFHEFTHMLDSELLAKKDNLRYAGISGYTEYHASQIELLYLIGAKTIDEIPSFSMNDVISTISGEKSIQQYVTEKYHHAISLFSRNDFPANLDTLKSSIGVLFNYWGLRSICEMHSIDYIESIDNNAFMKHISSINFSAINRLMHGWLDKIKIDMSINLYLNIISTLVKEYNLA